MNITKYPQSCVVIEKEGKRLLLDPGFFVSQKYTPETFKDIDAIILTHRHPDHVDPDFMRKIIAQTSAPVICNSDTAELLGELGARVINDGEKIEVVNFTLEAIEIPHVKMVDDQTPPPNTGFVIDELLLAPGDGIELSARSIPYVLLPIAGPDLSLRDARLLCDRIHARIAIPVHYSIFSDDKPKVASHLIQSATARTQLRILANEESTLLPVLV